MSSKPNSNVLDEEALRIKVETIKANLKHSDTFEDAVKELKTVMENNLNYGNKRLFYDALNIISYRVGKPGFEASVAKPVFDAAINLGSNFSSGYKKNIQDWKKTIDELVENPDASIERSDGRFNTVRHQSRVPNIRSSASLGPLLSNPLLRTLLGFPPSFESSSSDESPFPFFRRFMMNSSDDEDEDEDEEETSESKVSFSKDYPFFKFGDEILKPFSLQHASSPKKFQFSFMISKEQFARMSTPSVKISLCCFFKDNFSSSKESPSSVKFFINSKQVKLTKENGINNYHHGYDITDLCCEGKNTLIIQNFSCCCSYKFGIFFVVKEDLESLIEKTKKLHTLDYNDCLQRVLKSFNVENDIQELSVQISLRCPLSQMRIAIPSRGVECQHIQCFDLNSFLSMNRNIPNFLCPVCSSKVVFEDLRIDTFFEKLLKETSEENDEIEIQPNGTWKIPEDKVERKRRREIEEENRRKKGKSNY